MPVPETVEIRRLTTQDSGLVGSMLTLFGEVFEDRHTYDAARPDAAYIRQLLANEAFIALTALSGQQVVGALAAYELPKLEQARSEIYLYDLAVASTHRRRGVATALIDELREIAAQRGAWVVFVQADPGDRAAIALYESLGEREEVLHFDIPPRPKST